MAESSRIQLQSFRLKGLPFFLDQTFDLQHKGISLILGRNFDSSNNNSNAAGKSMFFSELAEMASFEPMIGEKGDTIRKGMRVLKLRKQGHDYKVKRSFSPKERIVIYKDGVDLGIKDLAAAKSRLFKLLPYTSPEVRSLLFIDSRTPHPLIRGNTSERREFLRRFFHMDAAPAMRKIIKSELEKITSSEGGLKEVVVRLKELKARSRDRDVDTLEAHLSKTEKRVKRLTVQVAQYVRVHRVYADYRKHRESIRELKRLHLNDPEELRERILRLEKVCSQHEAGIEAWNKYEEQKQERDAYRKEKARLRESVPDKYLSDPKTSRSVLKEKRAQHRESVADLASKRDLQEHKAAKTSEESQKAYLIDLDDARRKLSDLKEARGKCPTCGGPFENEHVEKRYRSVKKDIALIEEWLENAKTEHAKSSKKLVRYSEELSEAESKLELLDGYLEKVQQLLELESVAAVEKPPGKDKAALQSSRDLLLEELRWLREQEEAVQAVSAWNRLDAEQKAVAKSDDPTPELMQVTEEVGKLKGELSEARSIAAEIVELRERRDELKLSAEERPVLELLQKAMSKGGIESLMIEAICERLKTLVNRYSKMIFPEDYEFSFNLEPQFSFLVTRRYGKRHETSDVRKLSGAESLLFSLVLYVALMSFIPESKRTNVLMLDEPTANFSPEMTEAFVRFLPTLNSIVDHIIVITPMPQQPYPGAQLWTVVKKNGISSIMRGGDITMKAINDSRRGWDTPTKPAGSKTGRKRDRL